MAKPLHLKLTIPEPCTQVWDGMTPNTLGRHCSSCQKTVVDFSNFTDKELVEFFKKPQGEVCGRISSYQHNRSMPIIEKSNNSFFHRALFGGALLAGIAGTAKGQMFNHSAAPAMVPIYNGNTYTFAQEDHSQTTKKETPKSATRIIHGKVVDDKTKEPIENVEVSIYGSYDYASTDSAGKFELNIPDSLEGKELKIEFYNTWHTSVEVIVAPNKRDTQLYVSMKYHEREMMMGKMVPRKEP
ncbi:MAG TPA: carboxypeptidase-like regulatory domain-containing protein [Bacteroidia bacterium]|nr:carboxypeptidase-like regulatory domain-containing protein [Bacteroidia bacterium]